jgi:tetratricopeptide (TPR) repeat protein
MALGRQCYQEGRYREAAEAFRQAQQLNPSSLEAMNRLNDAERMAGPVGEPAGPSRPSMDGTQIAAATRSATPGFSAFAPTWIGPAPGGAALVPTSGAPATAPPPYIPVPKPTNTRQRPDLPPLPPPAPTTMQPFGSFEGPSRNQPGAESPSAPSGSAPPGPNAEELQPKPPPWTIWVNPPRKAVPAKAAQPQTPSPSAAEEARKQAERLHNAGRVGEAAQRYAEAEALYRSEADRGGPNRAAKVAAADVCRDARKLCESQAQ